MNNHQKGTQVNHTTPSARTPSPRTGFFAALRGALGGSKGTGAPSSGRVGARTPSLRLLAPPALALAALLALAAIPASALAARGHEFKESFGELCTDEPCGPAELTEPSAVAVNEATDNVYVADNNNRIDKFDFALA